MYLHTACSIYGKMSQGNTVEKIGNLLDLTNERTNEKKEKSKREYGIYRTRIACFLRLHIRTIFEIRTGRIKKGLIVVPWCDDEVCGGARRCGGGRVCNASRKRRVRQHSHTHIHIYSLRAEVNE